MISDKPWKLDAVLLLGAGLLICMAVGLALTQVLGSLLPPRALENRAFLNFLIFVVNFHGASILLVHHFLKGHQMTWRQFFGLQTGRKGRALAWVIAVAVLLVLMTPTLAWAVIAFLKLIHVEAVGQPAIKVLQMSVAPGERICFGVAALLVVPIAEESLFRGILYPFIKQRGYPLLALLGTSLLFALIHANLMTFVPLTFFAIVQVLLYEKTDVLWAPIFTHALFNAANFFLIFLKVLSPD